MSGSVAHVISSVAGSVAHVISHVTGSIAHVISRVTGLGCSWFLGSIFFNLGAVTATTTTKKRRAPPGMDPAA